jgi:hypothetical protein
MNIDNKNPILKNFLTDQNIGKKSLKSTIDQSSISSTEQKALDLELRNQNEKSSHQKSKKEKKQSSKLSQDNEKNKAIDDSENQKIERDPMKLLKVF